MSAELSIYVRQKENATKQSKIKWIIFNKIRWISHDIFPIFKSFKLILSHSDGLEQKRYFFITIVFELDMNLFITSQLHNFMILTKGIAKLAHEG